MTTRINGVISVTQHGDQEEERCRGIYEQATVDTFNGQSVLLMIDVDTVLKTILC